MGHKPWDGAWKRVDKAKHKRAWRNEAGEELRFYGTDVADEFETVAEATLMDDGTVHLTAVVLQR